MALMAKQVKVQIQLDEDLRTRFKAQCVLESTTMNDKIVNLIQDWTNKKESAQKQDK
jgi:hypothetical protein